MYPGRARSGKHRAQTSAGKPHMHTDAEEQHSIVRMLGAVLGDVIREQDGEDVFQQIEDIRRA